jgi:hypothetical protein
MLAASDFDLQNQRTEREEVWKRCSFTLKHWTQRPLAESFSRKSKTPIQGPTLPLIAASYIGHFWNRERRAGKGLRGTTMSTQTPHTPDRHTNTVLIAPTLAALWFLDSFAFRYLTVERETYGIYWAHRGWLYVHIVAGMLALLLGPLRFWLGLNRRTALWHRVVGAGYVIGVFVSSSTAIYLASHTDFGWVFGMGFTVMALAWLISTTFATIAICGGLEEQHRQWMLRSYVLTFGFVTFRLLTEAFQVAGIGTTIEQMTAASWLCWSIPLLLTEWVIQGRQIFAQAQRRPLFTPKPRERVEAVQLEIFDRASL